MNYCVAISYVNCSVPLSTTLLERECICETMNPGPILIIRNNFPTTIIHFLFSAIYKFENTKILLLLAFTIHNPKTLSIIAIIILAYHHCIFISCLHIYFLFAYLLLVCIHYYLYIVITPCAWQPLGEVEDQNTYTLFCVTKRRIAR